MRSCWLALLSALAAAPAFAQDDGGADLIVELRLGTRFVDTFAHRDASGAVTVPRSVIDALGLIAPPPDVNDNILLGVVPGLSYAFDGANAAIVLSCTAACYPAREIGAAQSAPSATAQRELGAFLNTDLSAQVERHDSSLAGAFELGAFGPLGAGGATWTINQDGQATRLETQWTLDNPSRRASVRLGDGVTRGGLGGAPARFGGVQWATDFSLDPGFIFYPTPSLHGEAATPSTVDVYIDGALRARHDAEAGPFSISDAPVITGAGVAELVVTDVLGRQQRFAQPFYASAAMLRPGLSDYSLALGALRENFGSDSFSYGGWMVSALERRGMTRNLTLEARLDAEDDLAVLSAGASFANHRTGQIDVALAQGAGESSGALTRIAWSRQSQNLAFNADLQNADAHFRRPGEDHAPPRLQASASASVNLGRAGAGSVAYVAQDWRDIGGVETLAFTYQPPALGAGRFDLSAFYVDAENEDPFLTLGVSYSLALNDDVTASTRLEQRDGRFTQELAAQNSPDISGGFGWRAFGSYGARERLDLSMQNLGAAYEAALDYSHTAAGDGLRGRYAFGLVWMRHSIMGSRPVRQSFALVDLGAPHIRVLRDRQVIGETDAHGRLLVTGLRAYEQNRIGVVLDDLPITASVANDEIMVTPGARSGAIADFALAQEGGGEVQILGPNGAPLPAGSILTRRGDGARFVVGADGKAFIDARADTVLDGEHCSLTVALSDFSNGMPLTCRG